ncbi:hypothetical protein KSP40_PGU013357 [Platanthera guangdongensis]|uniref:Uncharacterized protein n=1 Tax=Platanthera guangdongensis TaxID=2320717 RepID=A0ABR2LMQ1_9ASPA
MSLLSAGPGFSGAEGWLCHFASGDLLKKKEEEKMEVKGEKEKRWRSSRNPPLTASDADKGNKPRFALEFDGLNCFETIVSQY